MSKKNSRSSTSVKNLLSRLLIILVSGSLCLAVVDKDNRPAYFDIVKIAVGYAFGSLKQQEGDKNSNSSDDSNEQEE